MIADDPPDDVRMGVYRHYKGPELTAEMVTP